MVKAKRAISTVSVVLATAVLVLFLGFAPDPVREWPTRIFVVTGTVAAAAGALPWGVFYRGRWVGFEGRHWKRVLLVLIALAFAWFVWPTPYRDILGGGAHVNRITGATCGAGKSCW